MIERQRRVKAPAVAGTATCRGPAMTDRAGRVSSSNDARGYFFALDYCGTKVSVPALMPFQAGAEASVRYHSVWN